MQLFTRRRWPRTTIAAPIALSSALWLGSGCSAEDTSLGGNQHSACTSQNWRAPTADGVVCPGAPDCLCSGGQVCCVQTVNGKASTGSCDVLTACSGPALQCDGAEDCPSGQVCCFVDTIGGGSSCRTPTDCFGGQELQACRDDQECNGIEHCTPAAPGSYLDGIAAACQL